MKLNYLFILPVFFLFSCNLFPKEINPYTADLSHNEEISGLWLECWVHLEDSQMYAPGSYGAAQNPNFESFYYFKSDGTGYFLERYMNISDQADPSADYADTINSLNTNENLMYEVVSQDSDSQWIVEDELHKKWPLYWGVTSDNKLKLFREDHNGAVNESLHDFEFDPLDPRSDSFERTIDKYSLGTEMKIIWVASLKKINPRDSNEFLGHYLIE